MGATGYLGVGESVEVAMRISSCDRCFENSVWKAFVGVQPYTTALQRQLCQG